MALIRCAQCRYSFEHTADEAPTACPQCGERLARDAERASSDVSDHRRTQELKTIPKPEE